MGVATPAIAHRKNKRDQLYAHFRERLHQPQNSIELHVRFGTSVRTRISEINRDPDTDIVIRNHTYCTDRGEVSLYTAAPRYTLFGDISPERHRDDG
jgi:hypothetical protein